MSSPLFRFHGVDVWPPHLCCTSLSLFLSRLLSSPSSAPSCLGCCFLAILSYFFPLFWQGRRATVNDLVRDPSRLFASPSRPNDSTIAACERASARQAIRRDSVEEAEVIETNTEHPEWWTESSPRRKKPKKRKEKKRGGKKRTDETRQQDCDELLTKTHIEGSLTIIGGIYISRCCVVDVTGDSACTTPSRHDRSLDA
ncbi:hypothetical protein LZ32DRAFT_43445 [Colletotrichum eremochloae]|nr:hypothetical protein LZ32DRAFT_43445 [Colletotrichum eremochloae]